MIEKKCAVFSCLGLGDGLLALILSNNLERNGHHPTTFHPFIHELQGWFPHLPLEKFPSEDQVESVLQTYDQFFIMYEKTPWMQKILAHCLEKYPDKTRVINPIATPNKDYPYWEQARFDGNETFVDNLYVFCKEILELPDVTKDNGIQIPKTFEAHRYPQRVIIHPTSSRPGKNWSPEKYLQLSALLEERGFSPTFILTKEEKKERCWESVEAPHFSSLGEIAGYIAESGSMIGNDSGMGHLASCLGLPTVIICRSMMNARFWRPSWSPGEVLCPPSWIPNLKGLRWRDKHWQKWISVQRALSTFLKLAQSDKFSVLGR